MALIGAQMYTLRDYCQTSSDIARSCARVKAMGYDGIQVSAFGPIEARELQRILDGEGLRCAVTHVALDRLRTEPQAVIEEHMLWDCSYAAIAGFSVGEDGRSDDWLAFCKAYNTIASPFERAGIRLGYHNHSHELIRYEGRTALEILIDNLDPSIWFEIDTFWIAHGGGDPAQWIEKAVGRIPCVHYKDMALAPERQEDEGWTGSGPYIGRLSRQMCEIGSGNLNWPMINRACAAAGVEWYLVERDTGDLDPFDSLKISLDNMRDMGM